MSDKYNNRIFFGGNTVKKKYIPADAGYVLFCCVLCFQILTCMDRTTTKKKQFSACYDQSKNVLCNKLKPIFTYAFPCEKHASTSSKSYWTNPLPIKELDIYVL